MLRVRISGNPRENLERALCHLRYALRHHNRQRDNLQRAATLNNLGNVYRDVAEFHGPRAVERAAARFVAAGRLVAREEDFDLWSHIQANTGYALLSYAGRYDAARAAEGRGILRQLLQHQEYLSPHVLATVQMNLGNALLNQQTGDRLEQVREAISLRLSSYQIFQGLGEAQSAADAASNLGNAWGDYESGDIRHSQEEALRWHTEALRLVDRAPTQWASATDNLANDYRGRLEGNRVDNLTKAKELHEQALAVYNEQEFPYEWARACYNYAVTLLSLSSTGGDAKGLLLAAEHAIAAALRIPVSGGASVRVG